MDFFVYDNIYTFNKRHPFGGNPNSRIEVDHIELPENGSFWFFTEMELEQTNVNIQKRYVHVHPGIGSTNKVRFKKTPKVVDRTDLIYNPKEKRVEVKNHFWGKPIFTKTVTYYGAELPSKKMSCIGQWYFDFGANTIHFIIDYMSQKIKYSWVQEEEEETMITLMAREIELEEQIKQMEFAIMKKNQKGRFETIPAQNVDQKSDL